MSKDGTLFHKLIAVGTDGVLNLSCKGYLETLEEKVAQKRMAQEEAPEARSRLQHLLDKITNLGY